MAIERDILQLIQQSLIEGDAKQIKKARQLLYSFRNLTDKGMKDLPIVSDTSPAIKKSADPIDETPWFSQGKRKEEQLFAYLANNPGIIHSFDSLRAAVWGDRRNSSDRPADIYNAIQRIRKKYGSDCIQSFYGKGILFKNK